MLFMKPAVFRICLCISFEIPVWEEVLHLQKLRRIRVKIHELRQLHLPQPVQYKLVVQLPQEEMLVNMIRQFKESLTGKPPA